RAPPARHYRARRARSSGRAGGRNARQGLAAPAGSGVAGASGCPLGGGWPTRAPASRRWDRGRAPRRAACGIHGRSRARRAGERAPSQVRRLLRRAFEQLVEAVEIELDEVGGKAVRLRLGADKLAGALALRGEMATEHRDEGLERAGRVLRQIFPPEEIGEAI